MPTLQANLPRLEICPAVGNTSQKTELLATGEMRTTSIAEDRVLAMEAEIHALKQQYNNLISRFEKVQAVLRIDNSDKNFGGELVNECLTSSSYSNPLLGYEPAEGTGRPQHVNLESVALLTAPSLSKSTGSVVSSESGNSAKSFTQPLKQGLAHVTINDSVDTASPQLKPTLAEAFNELLDASLGILL